MRDNNLQQFDILLENIEKRYPDIIYLSSPELGELIETGSFHDIYSGKIVTLKNDRLAVYKRMLAKYRYKIYILITVVLLFAGIKFYRKRKTLN